MLGGKLIKKDSKNTFWSLFGTQGSLISLFTISPSGDNYIFKLVLFNDVLMMAIGGKQPLGTLQVQAGKIDEDQLQKALQIQRKRCVHRHKSLKT